MRTFVTRSLALVLVLAPSALAVAQAQPQNTQPQNPDKPAQAAPAPAPPPNLDKRPRLTDGTRLELIQSINAEFVRVRKTMPLAYKDIAISPEGKVTPADDRLYQLAQTYGSAAKLGDRVQITNIVFHEKSIYLEINGGPKKKSKWYQHVEIMGMGGAAGGADPNQAQPTGAAFSLEFKKYVPEMSGPELRQLLSPVIDWSVKSASEVYLDTVPPKIKQAIKNHEVLVGMNRDMVVMAKERPPQKLREKDEKGQEYEEWIYGQPPQDVTFVRFHGDEVYMVKTMKIGGATTVKTEKEVDVKEGVVSLSSVAGQGQDPNAEAAQKESQAHMDQPMKRPTLKKADEQDDPMARRAGSTTGSSGNTTSGGVNDHKEVPQWGTDGQEQPPSPTPPPTDRSTPPL